MKHYDSIPRIQDDGFLKGEMVVGYNKLDGQNFCVTYNCRKKTWGPYGSRTRTVDENDLQFGATVKFFNDSGYKDILANIVKEYSGKRMCSSRRRVTLNPRIMRCVSVVPVLRCLT